MIWLGEKYQQKRTHVFVLEKAMQEEWCSMQPLTAAAMSSWLAVLFNFGLAAKLLVDFEVLDFEVDPYSDEGQIHLFV